MRRLIPLLLVAIFATACNQKDALLGDTFALATPAPTATTSTGAIDSYDALITSLNASKPEADSDSIITSDILALTGKLVMVGSQRLQVFEYPDAASAQTAAQQFSRDGAWFQRDGVPVLVNWIATPHLYRSDRLLVVYVGEDADTLALLNAKLGQPFAGGANPYSVALQVVP